MSIIWGMDNVWQGWITPHTISWPPTKPMTYSTVTLDIGIKSLSHGPHQWCSCPCMRTQLWIWYPNILWVLCKSLTTSNSVRSPHRPPYVHKLHFRHAQLLPWFSKTRAWTIDFISSKVAKGWWYLYGHNIPLLMSVIWGMYNVSRLGSVNRPWHDLQLHPQHTELLPCILKPRACTMVILTSGVVIVVQGWSYLDGYDMQPFYECYMRHVQRLTGVDHPIDYGMASNYTQDILSTNPEYWKNQELEPCSSSAV